MSGSSGAPRTAAAGGWSEGINLGECDERGFGKFVQLDDSKKMCSPEISAVEGNEDVLSIFGSNHVTQPICAENIRVYDSNLQKCVQQQAAANGSKKEE